MVAITIRTNHSFYLVVYETYLELVSITVSTSISLIFKFQIVSVLVLLINWSPLKHFIWNESFIYFIWTQNCIIKIKNFYFLFDYLLNPYISVLSNTNIWLNKKKNWIESLINCCQESHGISKWSFCSFCKRHDEHNRKLGMKCIHTLIVEKKLFTLTIWSKLAMKRSSVHSI